MRKVDLVVLALVAVCLLTVSLALGQGGSVEQQISQAQPNARQEIERLEEQARQAALKGDPGFVEKYAAADYIAIMANGMSFRKAEQIESWRMGRVTYQTVDVHEL